MLAGVPAAYLLARRNFPLKRVIMVLFLLPVLMPPITYGIPLATVMYNFGLGRTLTAVEARDFGHLQEKRENLETTRDTMTRDIADHERQTA